MPKRGRKRKVSPTPDSEGGNTCASVAESLLGQAVKDSSTPTSVLPSTNRGKYVPRFGSAAKRQRVDLESKKLNRDASGEGDILLPISCTQPVGGANGAELDMEEGEWSSTQPAPKLSLPTLAEAGTNSLTKSQQDIPGVQETKLSGECIVPGLALSHGLPCFPNQMQHDDTNAENLNPVETGCSNVIDDPKSSGLVGTNVAESDSKHSNENEINDKCLDLLNPLHEDFEENTVSGSVEQGKVSLPLATTDSAPPADSHESAVETWPQNNRVDEGVLPNIGPEQAIAEPIVESFYAILSQEDNVKPIRGSCSDACHEEAKSDLVLVCTSDKAEAMREMEELRAVDLQESQLFAMAVENQAAHISSPPTNTCFVDAERRPSVCSRDAALQEGTRTVQGLIEELSALNRFILHCKKELETAFRQRRGARRIPHHQHPSGLHSGRNNSTHTHW